MVSLGNTAKRLSSVNHTTKTIIIINGFSSPYRLDKNAHGGGILLYVREDIPSTFLKGTDFEGNIEAMFVEINLKKKEITA